MRATETAVRGALRRRAAPPLLVAAAVVACATAPARPPAEPVGPPPPAHVEVAADGRTCVECHRASTPAVAEAWGGGEHGRAGVACAECHGSMGSGFVARPATTRCGECHRVEATTVALARCLRCHPAHALRPDTRFGSPHGPTVR